MSDTSTLEALFARFTGKLPMKHGFRDITEDLASTTSTGQRLGTTQLEDERGHGQHESHDQEKRERDTRKPAATQFRELINIHLQRQRLGTTHCSHQGIVSIRCRRVHTSDARARETQDELDGILPEDICRRVRWTVPFLTNRRLAAEVVKACPGDAKFIADCMDEEVMKAEHKIKAKEVRASLERNPERTRCLKEFNKMYQGVDVPGREAPQCWLGVRDVRESSSSVGQNDHDTFGRLWPTTRPMDLRQACCGYVGHRHPFRRRRRRPGARSAGGHHLAVASSPRCASAAAARI